MKRVRDLSGVEIPSALVHPYVAVRDGNRVATAYFDTHRVRTLPETLMIVVSPDGSVKHMEVIVFREPLEYLAKAQWYEQFLNQRLGSQLALKRDIDALTGATLTARATTDAVRRTLAIHQVIGEATSS